jgi:hypothetical protein
MCMMRCFGMRRRSQRSFARTLSATTAARASSITAILLGSVRTPRFEGDCLSVAREMAQTGFGGQGNTRHEMQSRLSSRGLGLSPSSILRSHKRRGLAHNPKFLGYHSALQLTNPLEAIDAACATELKFEMPSTRLRPN